MISIIIPTLNEAKNLTELFNRIDAVLRKHEKYEIIIVDSNSTDTTLTLAEKLAKKYPVKAFNTGTLDLSNSVAFGFGKASGNIIAVMDADLQHPPEMLARMLKKLKQKQADIVIASRFAKGAKTNLSFSRKIVSKVFMFLSHICCPKTSKIRDTSTGFFMFRKKVIENIDLKPIGFKLLLEILAKGNYHKIIEMPFHFMERKKGKSKFNFKQTKVAFKHLFRLAKYNREHQRLGKFCIVGGSGMIVNEGLLWLLTEIAGLFYLASGMIAIEASILTNFVLNDFWTFKKERKGNYFARLGKFNLARIFALSINFGALWLFTLLGLHYLVSNLIGIALATIFTYLTSLLWVWK